MNMFLEWMQPFTTFMEQYGEYLDWFVAVMFLLIGIFIVASAGENGWREDNKIRRVSFLFSLQSMGLTPLIIDPFNHRLLKK